MAAAASGSGPRLAAHWLPCSGNACWWNSRGRSWSRCWAALACLPDLWVRGADGWQFVMPGETSRSGRGSRGCAVPTEQQKWRWWRGGWRWSCRLNNHADGNSYGVCAAYAQWRRWGRRRPCRVGGTRWHSGPTQGRAGPLFFCRPLLLLLLLLFRPLLDHYYPVHEGCAKTQATSSRELQRASIQRRRWISLCVCGLGRRPCGSEEDDKQRCNDQW